MRYVIRPLRPEDLREFPEAMPYLKAAEEIALTPAFTALADGAILASAGILPVGPDVGEAWLVVRQPVGRHGRWLARAVRQGMYELMETLGFRRVQGIVQMGRPELCRWMRFLGLEPCGPDPTRPGNWLYAVERRET